jgi:hypothetical protein
MRLAKSCGVVMLVALVGVALAPALSAGQGGGGDSAVIPPQARYQGLSYGEWSARQTQWLFSLPVDHHPLFDTADVSAGQSGNVWFLGGTYASSEIVPGVILGEVHRFCTIPSGTALFFPMVDVETSTVEGYGSTEEELRDAAEYLAGFIVPASVFLEIDGQPVTHLERYRVESPLFTFGPLPDNNVEEATGVPAPAGTISPAVTDGYVAMVKPLSVGTHTLHFGGQIDITSIGGPLFIQDITYTITIVPRGRY